MGENLIIDVTSKVISDGEIYSGAELTSWTFQWDLTL